MLHSACKDSCAGLLREYCPPVLSGGTKELEVDEQEEEEEPTPKPKSGKGKKGGKDMSSLFAALEEDAAGEPP